MDFLEAHKAKLKRGLYFRLAELLTVDVRRSSTASGDGAICAAAKKAVSQFSKYRSSQRTSFVEP
jgi:hypothetical protein